MAGNRSMGGNTITQQHDPVRYRDAIHKRYVDTQTVSKQGVGEILGD